MPRPTEYDDEALLVTMAQLLAWPHFTHVTQKTEAAKQAIDLVEGSDTWSDIIRSQTVDRLIKAYDDRKVSLEAAAKKSNVVVPGLGMIPGPNLPTLLDPPIDPKLAVQKAITFDLRQLADDILQLADQLSGPRTANRDLLHQAKYLIRMAKKRPT